MFKLINILSVKEIKINMKEEFQDMLLNIVKEKIGEDIIEVDRIG